jgi:hypothetical protein
VAGYRDPKIEYENPHGEWNVMELFAEGDIIKFVVNKSRQPGLRRETRPWQNPFPIRRSRSLVP